VLDGRLRVTPGADTVLIGVHFDHGIWTEDADENLVNKPRGEVPGNLSSVHEKMHSKSLLGWSAAAGRPTGSPLEIVPLVNPFTLNPGDELPVQVLYDGAPVASAEVEILGVFDLFFTNRVGKVSLPIPNQEFQYVLVYHKVKLGADADADEAKLSANLTFTRAR
jgi:nickel transport protein